MRVFDYEPHASYREIAAELGLSQHTVRKIEKAALEKLQRAFREMGIDTPTVDQLVT